MADILDVDDEDLVFEPDYNPSSDMWGIYLSFPRPSMLSDELMPVYFQDRDGRWSPETKSALLRHNAKGLDLNDNWALTSRMWSCPGCGRRKEEIFRLSKRGILLAKLELHHDHMADFMWPRAEAIFPRECRGPGMSGSGELLSTIRDLVTRFSECLLCSDCNTADGKVKGRYHNKIDSRFTFTVSEIQRFIRPQPNRDHEIDYQEALAAWNSQQPAFATRLDLVETLLEHLSKGDLVRIDRGATISRHMWTALDSTDLLWQEFCREAKDTERTRLLSGLRAEFLARSTSRDSASLQRQSVSKGETGPTDAEFEKYVDPVSAKRWLATPANWACPVCLRAKREILRKSNKSQWSGGIREHREYVDESNPDMIAKRRRLFPGFRNEYWIKAVDIVYICSDCSVVGAHVQQRYRSLGDVYLTLQDLRDCLVERSVHCLHIIDLQLASQRTKRNEAYCSAWTALLAFKSKTAEFQQKLESWSRNGIPRSQILADLREDLRVYHRIAEPVDQEALVLWLLEQE